MSLRLVPQPSHPSSTRPSHGSSAPSAPGVHDTLRANLTPQQQPPTTSSTATPTTTSYHPLESRLAQWRTQQETLKMELLRRQFGIAEPVKRSMELAIVRAGEYVPAALGAGGSAGVHADILAGRDAEIAWEDVFVGAGAEGVLGLRGEGGGEFHAEMEGRFGMVGW
nr:proteasome maturation factor ump1 [Quercus suber]